MDTNDSPPDSSPRAITTHIRIVNLMDIDTKTATFKVHLVVFQEWTAPDTEARDELEEGFDRMDIDWKPEWHPAYELVGSMNTNAVDEFYTTREGDWYRVHWRCEIKTDIVQDMDLKEVRGNHTITNCRVCGGLENLNNRGYLSITLLCALKFVLTSDISLCDCELAARPRSLPLTAFYETLAQVSVRCGKSDHHVPATARHS